MSSSDETGEFFSDPLTDKLIEYSDEVVKNREKIVFGLEQSLNSDMRYNTFKPILNSVAGPLYNDIEGNDRMKVAEAILNITANYTEEIADYISEKNQNEANLVEFLNEIEARFRIKLRKMVNRQTKGNDWWSNISSDVGFRGGRPIFYHEITKDYDERVLITSDLENSLVLSHHFIRQVDGAQGELGKDVLNYISKETVDAIIETAESLAEDLEEYPDSVEITEEEADEKESVEDSAE